MLVCVYEYVHDFSSNEVIVYKSKSKKIDSYDPMDWAELGKKIV